VRVLAIVLALAVARPALGDPVIAPLPPLRFLSDEPAPAIYRKLVWEQKLPDGTTSPPVVGYWYTVEQVSKISARIDYLEERATKECVEATLEGVKHSVPWLWVGIGVVAGGVGGYFLWKAIR
jgi:hypothetical protein